MEKQLCVIGHFICLQTKVFCGCLSGVVPQLWTRHFEVRVDKLLDSSYMNTKQRWPVAPPPSTSHAYRDVWVSSTELLNWKRNRTPCVSSIELLRQHSDLNSSYLSDRNCEQASMSCSKLASETHTMTLGLHVALQLFHINTVLYFITGIHQLYCH